jgi:hypothetical protein
MVYDVLDEGKEAYKAHDQATTRQHMKQPATT